MSVLYGYTCLFRAVARIRGRAIFLRKKEMEISRVGRELVAGRKYKNFILYVSKIYSTFVRF